MSWLTILRKRPAFRAAFHDFEAEVVAAFDDADVARLLADVGIVRNRAKVVATIANAGALLAVHDDGGTLRDLLWSLAPAEHRRPIAPDEVPGKTAESTAMAKALKARGFRFVGPTTAYALMQAMGLVDDHLAGCHRAG